MIGASSLVLHQRRLGGKVDGAVTARHNAAAAAAGLDRYHFPGSFHGRSPPRLIADNGDDCRMVRGRATNRFVCRIDGHIWSPGMPRIAVFTKNRTNPAYEAARLGADRTAGRLGAITVHYVPDTPDSAPEQIALIGQAIFERPDAAVFVPVDETAVNNAILGFDAAGIPLLNIITRTTAGRRITFVGSDDRALARNIGRYLFG